MTEQQVPATDPTGAESAEEGRRRRRRARLSWSVPVAAVAAVGLGTTAFAMAPQLTRASAPPPRTAAQLLAAVDAATPQPFSGTVVETADLGIPALPGSGSSTSLTSLMSGSHTLRVWVAGPARERVAVIGDLAETDIVRNGDNAWLWYSASNSAEHLLLPASTGSHPAPTATGAEQLTPATAAAQALKAVGPTTTVSVTGTTTVAGRSAYVLRISPKQAGSLVDHVSIAIDAATKMPLRVQVFATGGGGPAFSTGYTTFRTGTPDASIFAFSPPPGAKVTTKDLRDLKATHPKTAPKKSTGARPQVIGNGWTSVVELAGTDATALTGGAGAGRADSTGQLRALLAAATPVSGSFGTGRVITTRLVSVLLLDNGKVFVGAVSPAVLERAASR